MAHRIVRAGVAALFLAACGAAMAREAPPEPPAGAAGLEGEVGRIAKESLEATGVPSVSISVVQDGRIAWVGAYGEARLEPRTPAKPSMRYAIGSVSKQFTAAAVLLLAQYGKLSLDDPVSRFLPGLTRAGDVRIRQLLSHTSGYRDYWPQDYVPPFMLGPATAEQIADGFAKRPLDFEPGTQYQYSNTGYVLAGLIVEKAGGMPLMRFLQTRVFAPLGMKGVVDVDQERLGDTDPVGYMRYGLGPLRPAPKEGRGWLFAAGELAMTAEDLARWNLGMIEGRLLTPASWRQMQTAVLLSNGLSTGYGLGVDVASQAGHRVVAHGGEVSGFTATNLIFPDDRAAVTVLANQDATEASAAIARGIAGALFASGSGRAAAEARARRLLEGFQQGRIDRALFSDNANSYFTEQALADLASGLAPLGAPTAVHQTAQRERGGMTFRGFEAVFPGKTLEIWERDLPDGKIEQFQIMVRQ
jgi:CubicO group peptidase (beta-lactamase class C family)